MAVPTAIQAPGSEGRPLRRARSWALEIGDFARFSHPRQLSAFLGLVPSEHTSDQKRRQGQITKAGPKHSRRLLVEAAKHAWRPPRVSEDLRRRRSGQDPRVCAVAWRAQRRLNNRWHRLATDKGKPTNVATVACARELATFAWEAATVT